MALNPEQCPNCDNEGFTVEIMEENVGYGGDFYQDVPTQIQCEFCYCNDNSIFNYNKMIERLKGEHLQ